MAFFEDTEETLAMCRIMIHDDISSIISSGVRDGKITMIITDVTNRHIRRIKSAKHGEQLRAKFD